MAEEEQLAPDARIALAIEETQSSVGAALKAHERLHAERHQAIADAHAAKHTENGKRIRALEAEVADLRAKLEERDRAVAELKGKVATLVAALTAKE